MLGPLSAGDLSELAQKARRGRGGFSAGVEVITERGVSTPAQLAEVAKGLGEATEHHVSVVNGSRSFEEPTAAFQTTPQTIGLWHCNEGSGAEAADSSDNENDLTLANTSWTTGKFSGGLSFNGTSSVASATLTSAEPVAHYLYFAAWINPTSGPLFQWEDVLEVYISGGSLVAQVEDQTYTGPAVGSGWQLAHVQFFDGKVFIGVGEIIWPFDHTDTELTVSAWAVTFGRRDSAYYSGTMDEMRLVADVIVQEDWGKRLYRASESSIMYCTFDSGSGSIERHQDFFGSEITLAGHTWETGYLGYCVDFCGCDSGGVFTPSAAATASELSIELVLKIEHLAGLSDCTLIDQTDGINLAIASHYIVAALNGVSNPTGQLGYHPLAIDTWYTLTLTWDGSTKTAWINGQKFAEAAATGTANIPASPIYIARQVDGSDMFAGKIDFLHIAKCVLRPQERPIPRFVLGLDGFEDGEDWVLIDD